MRVTLLLPLFLIALLTGCAAPSGSITVASDPLPHGSSNVMDARIQHINISSQPIDKALLALATAVRSSTDGKVRFTFGMEFSHSPRVSVHGANTTLRVAINEMCRQSGWSYTENPMIMFADDNRYFKTKR
jgi:hypothetical protein